MGKWNMVGTSTYHTVYNILHIELEVQVGMKKKDPAKINNFLHGFLIGMYYKTLHLFKYIFFPI